MAKKKIVPVSSISDLEKLLLVDDEQELEILPNGTIQRKSGRRTKKKVLTMRENLGGEYGVYC